MRVTHVYIRHIRFVSALIISKEMCIQIMSKDAMVAEHIRVISIKQSSNLLFMMEPYGIKAAKSDLHVTEYMYY